MFSPINNINFKGYDARPMRTIVMRNADTFDLSTAAREVRQIGINHGFSVILEDEGNMRPWIQDVVYFTKDKMLINRAEGKSHSTLCENYGLAKERIPERRFIAGGNLYLINNDGKEKILVGKSEKIKNAQKLFPDREIIQIPQADFHIDLFIRPLKDNNILVADDNMTLKILKNAKESLETYMKENPGGNHNDSYKKLNKLICDMEMARNKIFYSDTNEVISKLKEEGFNVIKTPGRIYKGRKTFFGNIDSLANKLNYINAIATIDDSGEIIYISNKSNLLNELEIDDELANKIGLNFEENFKKSVADYINPENIYFIEGGIDIDKKYHSNIPEILEDLSGGIHCLCAEIPKE